MIRDGLRFGSAGSARTKDLGKHGWIASFLIGVGLRLGDDKGNI